MRRNDKVRFSKLICHMTATTADKTNADNSNARWRWGRELLIAIVAFAVGLLILPAAIYGFGVVLLGPYGGGPHLGSFLGDYFRNLGSGSLRTWFLVLAPYLFSWTMRIVFWRWSRPKKPEDFRELPAIADVPLPPKTSRAKGDRREPFVSP